jgi:cellulose 1,4-beta-cellobiosidase
LKQVVLALALGAASAQQAGTIVSEEHPTLSVASCDASGCTSSDMSLTVDSNWRWLEDGGTNCFTGNLWNQTDCPSTAEGASNCAEKCSLEGATYETSYGITTDGDSLTLGFVTKNGNLTNVGSRNYLMNSDDKYEMFNLKNREFYFEVDVSNLPCGLNGALYFVEMAEDGGMSQYDDNNAGAKFGTGYCDAQCPHDLKFINGAANVIDWVPSDTDPNAGTGHYGTCCIEMDIWEANAVSQAYTPHTCSVQGQTQCEGTDCGDIDPNDPESRYNGVCDKDGCDLNPYRFGIDDFYGAGSKFDIDTTQVIGVLTQFITEDGTDDSDLTAIKRIYYQNGEMISSPDITIGDETYNAITDEFCAAERALFNESHNGFKDNGGMAAMGDALDRGVVLVMSLWDDHYANMLWLDSDYPTDVDDTLPGVARGSCPTDSGTPDDVETNNADSTVTFSNIKWGPIGSTQQ